MPKIDVPILHVVTDAAVLARADFHDAASDILRSLGPRVAVHLRSRATSGAELWRSSRRLQEVAQGSGAWLVINDRVDVALAVRAIGCQLPARGIALQDARRIAPELRVGVSVHSPEEAHAVAVHAPDWLVFGSVFVTDSHPGATPRGLDALQETARAGVPAIAIGGITLDTLEDVSRAGAHGVAVISAVWSTPDPVAAATLIQRRLDAIRADLRG